MTDKKVQDPAPIIAPNDSKWRKQVFIAAGLAVGGMFLSTSVILAIGMLPTLAVYLFEKSRAKSRAITVGAMNLAGYAPFLIDMWNKGPSLNRAMLYLSEPRTICVIYFSAAIGYMIEWAVTSIVMIAMRQQAKLRIESIHKTHADFEEQWGPEVSGRYVLDEYGFPQSGGDDLVKK